MFEVIRLSAGPDSGIAAAQPHDTSSAESIARAEIKVSSSYG